MAATQRQDIPQSTNDNDAPPASAERLGLRTRRHTTLSARVAIAVCAGDKETFEIGFKRSPVRVKVL